MSPPPPLFLGLTSINSKAVASWKIALIATLVILQLCSTKSGRQYVKERNAYVIIRELHKWESDENVIKAIENVIQILIGDEPEDNMANLHEVDVPDDIKAQLKKCDEKSN